MIKKVSKKFTRGWLMAFLVILFILNPIVANATGVDAVTTVMKNSAEISRICAVANDTCSKTILKYDASSGSLSFSNNTYSELTTSEKKEFMEVALLTTKESNLPTTQKNKVYNFIASQDTSVSSAIEYLKSDTSADLAEAKKWFRPFSGPISTVLGLFCIVITTGISLSVVFDICYLVLPGVQLILERGEVDKRPWGVSNEAWASQKEVESSTANMNKSSIQIYLRKRLPVFFLVAIVLGWLISGKIYDMFIYFMDAFSR